MLIRKFEILFWIASKHGFQPSGLYIYLSTSRTSPIHFENLKVVWVDLGGVRENFQRKKKINGKMNNSSLCISNFFLIVQVV